MAIGLSWATMIMAVSAQMAVPPLLGYWLDLLVGTRFLFLFLGLAVGVTLSTLGLMRIARQGTAPIDGDDDVGQSKKNHLG
jgi:F0F1-type ATP synthase assembly protein I